MLLGHRACSICCLGSLFWGVASDWSCIFCRGIGLKLHLLSLVVAFFVDSSLLRCAKSHLGCVRGSLRGTEHAPEARGCGGDRGGWGCRTMASWRPGGRRDAVRCGASLVAVAGGGARRGWWKGPSRRRRGSQLLQAREGHQGASNMDPVHTRFMLLSYFKLHQCRHVFPRLSFLHMNQMSRERNFLFNHVNFW